MKEHLLRAAVFAVTSVAVLAAADALSSGGMPTHVAFFAAAPALAFLGASFGLMVLRDQSPSFPVVCAIGISFGFLSVLGAPGSFMLAGKLGGVAWLLLGSSAAVLSGGLALRPWRRG